jgi:hypothetical protein
MNGQEVLDALDGGHWTREKIVSQSRAGIWQCPKVRAHVYRKWADRCWSDRHGPEAHRYLTWIVACLLAHHNGGVTDGANLPSLDIVPLHDGVTIRLDNLCPEVVKLGILIGQFLARTSLGLDDASDDPFIQQVYELWSWRPPTLQTLQDEKSEEVEEDGIIVSKPLEPPAFLDDLSEYLVCHDDDWRRDQLVLEHYPAVMLRASRLEWRDHGERLFRNLLFWEDRFNCLPPDRQPQVDMLARALTCDASLGRLVGPLVLGTDVNVAKRCFLLQAGMQAVAQTTSHKSHLAEVLFQGLYSDNRALVKKLPPLVKEKLILTSAIILHNVRQAMNAERLLKVFVEGGLVPTLGDESYGMRKAIALALNLTLPIAVQDASLWSSVLLALGQKPLLLTAKEDAELQLMWQQAIRELMLKFHL